MRQRSARSWSAAQPTWQRPRATQAQSAALVLPHLRSCGRPALRQPLIKPRRTKSWIGGIAGRGESWRHLLSNLCVQ